MSDHSKTDPCSLLMTQDFAHIVVVSQEWRVVAISKGAHALLGFPEQGAINKAFNAVFAPDTVHRLRSKSQVLSDDDPVVHILGCPYPDFEDGLNVTAMLDGSNFVFAFEAPQSTPKSVADAEQVVRLIRRVARKETVFEAAVQATRCLRALTVMDRVSLHPVRAGRVWPALAKTCGYPLDADVPDAVLRKLDEDSVAWAHYVPDLDRDGHVMLSQPELGATFDTSRLSSRMMPQTLRAALAEDGVRTVHSVPVHQDGRLWGVLLCHSNLSGQISFAQRGMINLYAVLLGHTLGEIAARETAQSRTDAAILRETFLAIMQSGVSFADAFADTQAELAVLLPNSGTALWYAGTLHGDTADITQEALAPLLEQDAMLRSGEVFCLSRLSDLGIRSGGYDPETTGLLVVPMSGHATDMALFFRAFDKGDDTGILWGASDLAVAEILRSGFLEANMRASLQENKARAVLDAARTDGQTPLEELLQYVLDHVSKIEPAPPHQPAPDPKARMTAVLEGLQSLGDGPDSWGHLQQFVKQRLRDQVPDADKRVRIDGDDLLLTSEAFATLALVLADLMQNAIEHGALGKADGTLRVTLHTAVSGQAVLTWQEETGTPIRGAPEARGLGLRVIEHAVPFALDGNTEIAFERLGLHVRVSIPAYHIRSVGGGLARTATERPDASLLVGRVAIVLDDNLLVAIDTADQLSALGARHVYTCNTVDLALHHLGQETIGFALLDVDLGQGTSQALADRLRKDGIPAALATGYSADSAILKAFPEMPFLVKPYSLRELAAVVRKSLPRA